MILRRALAGLAVAAALTVAGATSAYAQADQPGGIAPSQPGGPVYLGGEVNENPAPLGPGIPRADILEVMVRSALTTFNDANLTGNYAVLSARLHPEFRQQVPAEKLASIFAAFRAKKVNLAPLLAHPLVYSEAASIDANGLLLAKGQFETRPWRTLFDLAWRRDGDQWLLWKINVRAVPAG
jgi:hypothetical protein